MICSVCGLEYESKRADSKFCSAKCRVTANRNKSVTDKSVTDKSVTDKSVTDKSVTDNVTDNPASLEDYKARPSQYARRTNPDSLNWGSWLSAGQLVENGYTANRCPIPGDYDYEGIVKRSENGVWAV